MKILILSSHPDDGAMGCGGTIAKFLEEGKEVYYIIFSWAEQGFSQSEIWKSLETLGVPKDNITLLNYRVRNFNYSRQQILEDLVLFREKLNPDMVLIPSSFDTHQDHRVIYEESLRAFRNYTLLGYEESWNNIKFESKCFVTLKEKHVQKKVEVAKCYLSQKDKIYMDTELVVCRARDRGTYIRKKYAEAFEVIRIIL